MLTWRQVPVVRGKPAKLAALVGEGTPSPDFLAMYTQRAEVRECVDMAMRLEGTNRSAGVHAAGVVIAPESFTLSEVGGERGNRQEWRNV